MMCLAHASMGLLIASIFSFPYPIVLIGSLLPDIDLLIPSLSHRGITHSLLFIGVISGLIRFKDKKKSIMFFLGASSHLFLDSLTYSGLELFWPLPMDFGFSLVSASSPAANLLVISVSIIVLWNKETIQNFLKRLRPEKIRKVTYALVGSWILVLAFLGFFHSGIPTTLALGNEQIKTVLNNKEAYNGEKVTLEGKICSEIEEWKSEKNNKFRIFELCKNEYEIKIWDLEEKDIEQLNKGNSIQVTGTFTTQYQEPEIYYVENIKKK